MESSLLEKVKVAVEKIRPSIQMDGGDIYVIGITEDNVAQIELLGACHGCPMSIVTLKFGVERIIKQEVPEIKGVELI